MDHNTPLRASRAEFRENGSDLLGIQHHKYDKPDFCSTLHFARVTVLGCTQVLRKALSLSNMEPFLQNISASTFHNSWESYTELEVYWTATVGETIDIRDPFAFKIQEFTSYMCHLHAFLKT